MKPNVHLKGHCGGGFGWLSVNAMSIPIALLAGLLLATSVFAATTETSQEAASRESATQGEAAKVGRITPERSDAELLIGIQKLIAQEQRRLRSLKARSEQSHASRI